MSGCHSDGGAPSAVRAPGQITVALAGQPNVGKTTVFNMLTGLNQHVGNWPGKTVSQKTGTYRHNGTLLELIDLPGTYSLTANSEEERIARDYLIREQPDVVVAIVNAAALERSLYLVAELLSLRPSLVVGLNMGDVAEQNGIRVEPHVLAAALGAPVVPLVAARNEGLLELMDEALRSATQIPVREANRPAIRAEHGPVLATVMELIQGITPAPYAEDWVALKLLEGDSEIASLMEHALPEEKWRTLQALLRQHEDAYLDIAGGRYEWIGRMVRAAVTQPKAGAITQTERIDRIATHPFLGLVVLLAMFGLVFWVTYSIATPIAAWLSNNVLAALDAIAGIVLAGAPGWLASLVSDGLIHGVGTVLTFLPILVIFFAVLGILEDVGYLSRGAYVMDRFMHLMGLHGKSFLPLFLGFGCNVPAVLGARIIEDRRARYLTILLAPLVPCTARLAVIAFLAPAFFGSAAALASWSLVAGSLLVLAATGIIINRLAFRGEHTAFIMELPLYHIPNGRTVGLYVWHNTIEFVKKAGTLILLASIAVWALSTLPGQNAESSYLAGFGRWLEPAGRALGLGDWRLIVALLTSFFAKENTIATLGILYGGGASMTALPAQVAAVLAPAARMAFMVVILLFIPCLATTATIKQETGSWRWTAASILLLLGLSVGAGMAVYQVGTLLIG
jgi:ferrous iron transport protein B